MIYLFRILSKRKANSIHINRGYKYYYDRIDDPHSGWCYAIIKHDKMIIGWGGITLHNREMI